MQRFGKLKVEATSFTISEPVESLTVSAMIYDLAEDEQKRILESEYDVTPFSIQTITLNRIFIDKLFAAEAYVRKSDINNRAFEAAKHIYDLMVMANQPDILKLLTDANQMEYLLHIRMREEIERLDGIPNITPSEFTFFANAAGNTNVRNAYKIMQNQYVMRESDKIDFEKAMNTLETIHQNLIANPAWLGCQQIK